MNKTELIHRVSELSGLNKSQAEKAVGAILASLEEGVKKDGSVQIMGFGTFKAKTRKERTGVNPATKAKITIPAKNTVSFKAGSDFLSKLK